MPLAAIAQDDLTAYVLLDLAIVLLAARIGGKAAAAVGQPRVVGQIVAGILIGPTLLGGHVGTGSVDGSGLVDAIFPTESFAFLSLIGQIGLVFFMFLIGIEVDDRLLKGHARQIAVLGAACSLAPMAIGFLAAPAFDGSSWRPEGVDSTTFALFLGAGLTATAFPLLARILQEKGLMSTAVGAIGFGASGIVSVFTFLMIGAASASAEGNGVAGSIGAKAALTVALVVFLIAVARPAMAWALDRVDEEDHLGTIITALLGLALLTGLAADRIGINALVGGFLFGIAVPASPQLADEVLAHLKEAVLLFFLPVFFAVSGLRTDFRTLEIALVPGILLFLALMTVGKWGVGYLAGRAVGLTSPQANAVGALLNCPGLLILVVGLIGLQLGVITQQLQAVFVLSAVLTAAMVGPLVDHFLAEEPASREPEPEPSAIGVLQG